MSDELDALNSPEDEFDPESVEQLSELMQELSEKIQEAFGASDKANLKEQQQSKMQKKLHQSLKKVDDAQILVRSRKKPATMRLKANLYDFNNVVDSLMSLLEDPSPDVLRSEVVRLAQTNLAAPSKSHRSQMSLDVLVRDSLEPLKELSEIVQTIPRLERWTPLDWIENTVDTWLELTKPLKQLLIRQGKLIDEKTDGGSPFLGLRVHEFSSVFSHSLGHVSPTNLAQTMFAFKISESLGLSARYALSSSDMGIPLTDDCLGVVIENYQIYANELPVPFRSLLKFSLLHGILINNLFSQHSWLTSQLRAFANHFMRKSVNPFQLFQDKAERALARAQYDDYEDIESLIHQAFDEGDASTSSETEPKPSELILKRIEWLMSLIEAWASVSAYKVMSKNSKYAGSLLEIFRRRRTNFGSIESAIAFILGHPLDLTGNTEAYDFWLRAYQSMDRAERDAIWDRFDNLPSLDQLKHLDTYFNPPKFSSSSSSPTEKKSTLDWDAELKKFFSQTNSTNSQSNPQSDADLNNSGQNSDESINPT
ncbi:MAG: zinc-dependent metalloprotease [Bifidobacteriaceae bacterium]|nr:zinc-dependent metalloprotease [Bifidobacteriaceae bacterium]